MNVSIIVPVYNRADLTARFIASYKEHLKDDGAELIVADDASTDGTPGLMGREVGAKYVRSDINQGFSKNCNLGARHATGEILLFINNDVVFDSNFLPPVRSALAADPRAVVGADVWTWNTGWNCFEGQVIPYVPGWFVAMTRATYDELGQFDERYSPYDYEDLDFSYAAVQDGRSLVKVPVAVTHLSGQSFPNHDSRRIITEINRKRFADKWGFRV